MRSGARKSSRSHRDRAGHQFAADQTRDSADRPSGLGQIFDTSDFYIAFRDGDDQFPAAEVEKGEILPKRSRKAANGLTEYIIRSGQPLVIRAELEKARERLERHVYAGTAGCFAERLSCLAASLPGHGSEEY
jgi:hypothetical protein